MTHVEFGDGDQVDTGYIGAYGVPMVRNIGNDTSNNDFYFTFHHSAGDSMTMMNPFQMDQNVVSIASLMYVLANLEVPLPKD